MAGFSGSHFEHGVTATSVALGMVLVSMTPSLAVEFWIGSASTDWFSVGNWTAIVPDNTTSTRIDTITPNPTVVGAPGAQATGLRVGVSATGALTIRSGGTINNTLGIIGDNAGSIGTATVNGAGSSWINSSDFYVGHNGNGTLTISNGGTVSSVVGFVGRYSTSTSTATVDGAGSSWTNSSDLLVGYGGNGTLTIRNGGAVSNEYGYVGADHGATGVVTVDGARSTWTNSSDLLVGDGGNGTLTIRNGGAVSNEYGFVGNASGATGAVTVDGAGSTWTTRWDLYVGSAGNGTLNVLNGGTVSSSVGLVAVNPGSTGAVTVNGAGSGWTTASDLYVGSGGSATLAILNGGSVSSAGGSYLGVASGAVGTATVDGAGSRWTSSGNLGIGSQGSGTLTIRNGAAVSNAFGSLAIQPGSTGTVTVDGTGSTWTNSADIHVGYGGTGTLTVRNGASVSASTMFIAYQAGSVGTLNIGAAVGQAATAPGMLSAASVNLGSGNGEIVFNHTGTNYTFAPVITGSGAGTRTVRVEAGKTILTAASTYTGPTIIDGGTLSVNGSIASSAVTVNAGGTLGGSGTVGNTMINGGTLAPGNSIGLLTVNGSLSFTAASSYMVEISPTSADRVNVSGTATLSGATVNASFAPGSYVAKQYTIVNAGGGISGRFGSVVNSNLPSGFKSSLSYDANNAYLDLALAFVAPPNTGLNINQTNVGNALVNYFNVNGGIPLVYGGLTAPGLTQASGEIATAVQPAMVHAMTQFTTAMTDVGAADRSLGQSSAMGLADEGDLANAYASVPLRGTVGDTFSLNAKAAPRAPPFESRWRAWASGFGGGQTTDGNAVIGSSAATSRMFGVAAGADYWLSRATVAGFALAGGGTNFNAAAGGSGRTDLFQTGAFIKHMAGPAYVSAAAAYGWHDVTTDRTVAISGVDQLRARFRADNFAGRLEGGSRFGTAWLGGLGLTPYAAAQVTTTRLPRYAETVTAGANTFALSYRAKTVTAPRTELGMRNDKSFALSDALLTLRGRAAWAHDFNPLSAASASFEALPGASFVVNGAAAARDAALTTVSAEVNWLNGVALAATFEGEFSAVTRAYAGRSVARYRW
ncbi:autotransporter domain-containing protein [Bradyrhizobium ontarionense]|uniref:Autotransporter domain-containing protein n=1 Tax=Bradyrhizobium ontarionense TaxID=2898149 RepID=A0ABY3RIZ9_9BRAD|nr:autotransporter domain-containing protein [Bradyrhizobium sp. A19]UFZ06599.1 autotransporter domain-containing protein [Bradyrhizobium sp. A19]